ncbi:MAG: M24 family metallopeptidase [Alphaproteobacteria bacterium]|nr:M24 family metallopeptidase [Alphaproteobacteria bacterium]
MSHDFIHHRQRTEMLRNAMEQEGIDGYILPRTDEFQGEFLAAYAQRLQWLTGFTGSAGVAVILDERAVVMSDGRYTLQLKEQVDSETFETANSIEITVGEWLVKSARTGDKIGFDEWLFTSKQIEKIIEHTEKKGVHLVPMQRNLIDEIWRDQPKRPRHPVTIFPDDVAGKTSRQKRQEIADKLKANVADACLLTMADSICWLLNVRGSDIDFSPLMLSYAVLYKNGDVDWFIDQGKVSGETMVHIAEGVRVKPFNALEQAIEDLTGKVWLDKASVPLWFSHKLSDCELIDEEDPCWFPKAIKTPEEQAAIRQAHILDGVAIVKFLKWLDETKGQGEDELSIEVKLERFRKEHSAYEGPSFSTIAGYGANGAVIHYRATEKTNKKIEEGNLLLVDSGGQYAWGTTDITRTIAIGTPTDEMKENYTRVLKGHIAVSKAVFDKGTLGKDIDALARKSLQEVGLDYAHGTGHGVGCYLGVHEAAANLSIKGERVIEAGMLLSNEPGYYKEGAYGIRIENLVLCHEKENGMLGFETVTFAPYDPNLIVTSMFTDDEMQWLQKYHSDMIKNLSLHLTDEEKGWLDSFCLAIVQASF